MEREKTIVKGDVNHEEGNRSYSCRDDSAGCALQEKRVEQSLTQPINCDIAEGDIRVLESEKAHVEGKWSPV